MPSGARPISEVGPWVVSSEIPSSWEIIPDKKTNLQPLSWPVYGYAYDVLIGGPFSDQQPEWAYDLHAYTMELAVPVTQANKLLKRVRQLIDEAAAQGKAVTSTYRSGINIKVRLVPFCCSAMVINWVVSSVDHSIAS